MGSGVSAVGLVPGQGTAWHEEWGGVIVNHGAYGQGFVEENELGSQLNIYDPTAAVLVSLVI